MQSKRESRSTRLGPSIRFGWIVVGLLALLPYLNALPAGFVYDDRLLVIDHPAITEPFDLGSVLTTPFLPGVIDARMWRPLVTLSYALDHQLAGSATWWPHLVNLLMHLAVTLLLYQTIRVLFRREALALVVGALFAAHPVHTEAVSWVAGRAELMAAGFGLLALLLALSDRAPVRWLTPLAVLLAVGSKESAAGIPLLLLYTSWAWRGRQRRPPAILGLLGIGSIALYLFLRHGIFGTWGGSTVDAGDNPMVATSLFERLPTVLDCVSRYLGLLFWPARLSADYSAPVLQLVVGMTIGSLVGLLAVVGLLTLVFARRGHPEGWGAAFTLTTFAVASNIPIVIGTIFAERLLYLPSAGLILIIVSVGFLLASRRATIMWILCGVLVVALLAATLRTLDRNRDYRSEDSFYAEGAVTQPRSPKMHGNLALLRSLQGRHEEALREAAAAIRLDSSRRNSRKIYAHSLEKLGRVEEAITFLRLVLQEDPGDRRARRKLIRLLDETDRRAEADSVIEAGLREDPEAAEWIQEGAAIVQRRGDYRRAAALWRKAQELVPESTDAPLNLGFCLLLLEDPRGARAAYAEALRRSPESAAAANGLAWSILESGGSAEEAVRSARRAVELGPLASHYDTLARAAIAAGNCAEAVQAASTAVSLDSTHAGYRERLREIEVRCR
jgi:tetratricopeptide (TPR) repeat protein